MKDNMAQKILAGLFVLAYFGVTYTLFDHFFVGTTDLQDYELGMVSTLFGGMSTKVNTIVDFYFGGSLKHNNEK